MGIRLMPDCRPLTGRPDDPAVFFLEDPAARSGCGRFRVQGFRYRAWDGLVFSYLILVMIITTVIVVLISDHARL